MNYAIPFIHRKSSRSRSVKIHVEPDGTVVVTTPSFFATSRIPPYLEKARAWIEERKQEGERKPKLLTEDHVYLYGSKYEIRVDDKMDGSVRVESANIVVSPVLKEKKITLILEKWLKNRCVEYCLGRLEIHSKKMNVTYKDVRFKQQKTCWGSCSQDKNLNFNWRLIHAPKEVIDYVIIHELAHTVHMNHGHRFWDLVARFDPDHPIHRGWLKRYGASTG